MTERVLGAVAGFVMLALAVYAPAAAAQPQTVGNYNLYVASLNLGSVNVATSPDNGTTFSQTPVHASQPVDDREWIAAFGGSTSLLTFHDIATNDIDVLRSDNAGQTCTQASQVIPETDYKAGSNELGNLVIDHDNIPSPDNSTRTRRCRAFEFVGFA